MLITSFRNFCTKWYFMLPLIVVFIAFSCQQSESITPDPKKMAAKNFSGEEVFRGIFFYQGDIVENFPSIQKNRETIQTTFNTNLEAEQVYQEFTDQIIEKIKVIDPNYFEEFKTKISTKNLYQIEEILESAKYIIKDAGYLTDYKNIFELSDELEAKKVVINKDMFDPSAAKESNYHTLRNHLNEEYSVSLAERSFGDVTACCLYVVFAVGAIVAAVAVVALAAYWVYAGVEFWGVQQVKAEDRFAKNLEKELVLEVSDLLN